MKIIEKFKKHWSDPLYRNSYYLMGNSIVGSALGFIFLMVVAKFYDAAELGLAVALISSAGIVTSISRLGLDVSIVRYLSKEKDKKGLINTCLTIVGIASFVIAIVFLLGLDLWGRKLDFVKGSWLYICAFVVFTTIFGLLPIVNNVFVAMRDTKYALIQNTIFAGLKIPLPIVLAPIFATFGIFGAWGLSLTAAILIGLFFFMRRAVPGYVPYPEFKKEKAKEIFHFSAGNYVVNLFAGAPTFVLPLIILHFLAPEENAYYYVSFAIASLLFVIPGAFSMSLFAEGSFKEEKFFHNLKRAMMHTYIFLLPAIIAVALLGKWVLLIFGAEYSKSGYLLLMLLAGSGIFVGLNSFYGTYLRIRLRIREMVVVYVLLALGILGVATTLLATTEMGIMAVGFAYLGTQGAFSLYVGGRFLVIVGRSRSRRAAKVETETD